MNLHRLAAFALGFFIGGFLALVMGTLILIACHENGVGTARLRLLGFLSLVTVVASIVGLVAAWLAKVPRADTVLADYDDRPPTDPAR